MTEGLRLSNQPPLLHTRAGNESFDRPSTPADNGFTSPIQTPQGSPSKNHLPPGAIDLPNVFEKALKLTPSTPNKSTYNHAMFSPPKSGRSAADDFNQSVIHQPDSPTRRANKENTPPSSARLNKDLGLNTNSAASARQEPYQTRDADALSRRQVQLRGLTAEEMEKLQHPRVKRLANVTQLCMCAFGQSCESVA